MSSGQEFLNDQERDILTGEKLLEQARATRDIAQLAVALGLADEQAAGLVGAFRLRAEQFDLTTLEAIRQHATGLMVAIGDAALHVSIEEQNVVDIATIDNAHAMEQPAQASCASEGTTITPYEAADLTEAMTREAADEAIEQVDSSIDLDPSAARFLRDIFGDCSEFNLQESDKPLIVEALMTLRAVTTQTPKAQEMSAKVRARLAMKLAGANNQAIADFEGRGVHNIESALSQLKCRMRNNYDTLDARRGVLQEMLEAKTEIVVESSIPEPSIQPALIRDNYVSMSANSDAPTVPDKPRVQDIPLMTPHENKVPISSISYKPTVLDRRQRRAMVAREQAVPLSSQPEFDRLKKNIKAALGEDAVGLLAEDVTVADLESVITSAYAKKYDAQPYDNFVRFFIANLEGNVRTFELAKEYALDLSTVGSICKTMPGLIAAELRAGNQTGSEQAAEVVTLRKPQSSPEVSDSIEPIAVAKPTLAVMSGEQPAGDVSREHIDYSPVVQNLIKAAIEPESTTVKEWFAASHQFIMGLEQFSPEEKTALWNRICHDPRKRKHTHLTSHTRAAIDKLRLARDKVAAMPDELIGTSLDYFLQADEGKYDIADIHTKISYKYDKSNKPPVHAIERCVTAGIGAVLAG